MIYLSPIGYSCTGLSALSGDQRNGCAALPTLIVSFKCLVESWNKKEGTNRGIVLIADQVLKDLEMVESRSEIES